MDKVGYLRQGGIKLLIQRVNRTDAEKIFMVVHNVEESSITTGFGARFVGWLL